MRLEHGCRLWIVRANMLVRGLARRVGVLVVVMALVPMRPVMMRLVSRGVRVVDRWRGNCRQQHCRADQQRHASSETTTSHD